MEWAEAYTKKYQGLFNHEKSKVKVPGKGAKNLRTNILSRTEYKVKNGVSIRERCCYACAAIHKKKEFITAMIIYAPLFSRHRT